MLSIESQLVVYLGDVIQQPEPNQLYDRLPSHLYATHYNG